MKYSELLGEKNDNGIFFFYENATLETHKLSKAQQNGAQRRKLWLSWKKSFNVTGVVFDVNVVRFNDSVAVFDVTIVRVNVTAFYLGISIIQVGLPPESLATLLLHRGLFKMCVMKNVWIQLP